MPKTVGEISQTIQNKLAKATKDINETFKEISSEEIIPQDTKYLVNNRFWDKWLQKLFAQLISVKVWGLCILTVLISMNLITGSEFIVGFSLIVGAKGGKDIVMKWVETKNNLGSNDVIDKV